MKCKPFRYSFELELEVSSGPPGCVVVVGTYINKALNSPSRFHEMSYLDVITLALDDHEEETVWVGDFWRPGGLDGRDGLASHERADATLERSDGQVSGAPRVNEAHHILE